MSTRPSRRHLLPVALILTVSALLAGAALGLALADPTADPAPRRAPETGRAVYIPAAPALDAPARAPVPPPVAPLELSPRPALEAPATPAPAALAPKAPAAKAAAPKKSVAAKTAAAKGSAAAKVPAPKRALAAKATAGASDLVLLDAAFTLAVEDREPARPIERVAASPDKPRVWAWIKVANDGAPTTVTAIWRKGGEVVFERELKVGQSPGWRTWSAKTLRPADVGEWTVEIRDAQGRSLGEIELEVTQPGALGEAG